MTSWQIPRVCAGVLVILLGTLVSSLASSTIKMFCNRSTCNELFHAPLPDLAPTIPAEPGKLTRDEQCRLLAGWYVYLEPWRPEWLKHASPTTICKYIQIVGEQRELMQGLHVSAAKYRKHTPFPKIEGPHLVFSPPLPIFMPCWWRSSLESTSVYFQRYPERKDLFRCLLVPFREPLEEENGSQHERKGISFISFSPFQPAMTDTVRFLYSVPVDPSLIKDGLKALDVLRHDAENVGLRSEVCKSLGDECVAPRIVRLVDVPVFDEAIAYCAHMRLSDTNWVPTQSCVYVAIRTKTGRYFLMAFISPEAADPHITLDGLGDADIVCKKYSSTPLADILAAKFPPSAGWQVGPSRVSRLGHISDVYGHYWENFVMRIWDDPDRIRMTPIISFSPQNVREQSQYRPISTVEYSFYETKINERLAPELKCNDARNQ